MEVASKAQYAIRNLGTKAVTLFPTKAQICREIKDVELQPGVNEVTIIGLSPTVDEQSVKVEGTGSAVILDIAVESRPNHERFEDVYPDDDDEVAEIEIPDPLDLDACEAGIEKNDSYNANDDIREDDAYVARLKRLINDADSRLKGYDSELSQLAESINNAEHRLQTLETWSATRSTTDKAEVDIGAVLRSYKEEGDEIQVDLANLRPHVTVADDARGRLYKKKHELLAALEPIERKREQEKDMAELKKQKERSRKERERADRAKEKQRLREKRAEFWPKYCYAVRITLESNAWTPMSSRRGSVSSEVDLVQMPGAAANGKDKATAGGPLSCNLTLTYVTVSAHWSPSYDLQLSTVKAAGTLCFDAELHNATSETWGDCSFTLSSSQSTFGGLDETIPSLEPWYIRIGGRGGAWPSGGQGALRSRHEEAELRKFAVQQGAATTPKQRSDMFGLAEGDAARQKLADSSYEVQQRRQEELRRQMVARSEVNALQAMPPPPPAAAPAAAHAAAPTGKRTTRGGGGGSSLFGAASTGAASVFGGASSSGADRAAPRGLFGAARHRDGASIAQLEFAEAQLYPDNLARRRMGEVDEALDVADADDNATLSQEQPALEFVESLVEETGLTTTYDLPGLTTLVPKSGGTKHRVARITMPNAAFGHVVVAKYRPVAYLKAKLRNPSRMTLLAGPCGLTLDGSFLGRAKLPRCSPGESFSQSLGADPALRVTYPRPDVRRSTTGMLSREDSAVYVRTLVLHNARATAGRPLSVEVHDQVPVSEDDRLRVAVVTPSHLATGGPAVETGLPGRDAGEDKDWGHAQARLKKGGEVHWDVSLKAGKAVKLVLEYSVAAPSGDQVNEC